MPYSPVPVGNQFIRNFPVPLDRDLVFATTADRLNYLTNASTSGIAYSGMISADLQTNKIYLLGTTGVPAVRAWLEVGAETVDDLFSTSGIMVKTGNNTFASRGLDSGNNIGITNPSGIAGNPTISLNNLVSISGLTVAATGLDSNNLTFTGSSGNAIYVPSGIIRTKQLVVDDTLYVGNKIDISTAATIVAQGALVYKANPLIVDGSGIFVSGLFVGPSGSPTGVSLSGHKHTYTPGQGFIDIPNFCSGVADCVDTALSVSTGLQFTAGTKNLTISLSGQALALHNLATTGILVRRGDGLYVSRAIEASGSNILIGSGNGYDGNPTIGLNPTINNLSKVYSDAVYTDTIYNKTGTTITLDALNVNATGNFRVGGNLIIDGDTVTQNVSTVQIEDPIIRLGGTGVLNSSDSKDRGIEFIYQTGNAVSITGFFGFDVGSRSFTLLSNATNSNENYTTGTSGLLNIGGLFSSSAISGTRLISTINNNVDAPLTVASTGLVSNFNSDYLDGEHGSYYRNSVNLTGIINNSVLPAASTSVSGISYFNSDNFSVAADTKVSIKTSGIRLGVHTSGQYASTLAVAGTGLSATTANALDGTAYTISINSTPLNTISGIVARDINGNFSAGYMSGVAQNVDNIRISGVNTSFTSTSILLTNTVTATGYQAAYIDDKLTYDAFSNILGLTSISGNFNTSWLGAASPTYGSTSISGTLGIQGSPSAYLHNFVIDGGSP